jgi:hypothetical protein
MKAEALDLSSPKKKKTAKKASMLSKGERDLYRTVREIKTEQEMTMRLEQEREMTIIKQRESKFYGETSASYKPPTPTKVKENKARFANDVENKVTEWEKNTIQELFKSYDKDNSGALSVEEMTSLVNDLRSDKCVLGKVPDLGDDNVASVFERFDKNADGKISWVEF